jgi:hypothetical protein
MRAVRAARGGAKIVRFWRLLECGSPMREPRVRAAPNGTMTSIHNTTPPRSIYSLIADAPELRWSTEYYVVRSMEYVYDYTVYGHGHRSSF